jgi:hypothetical protein
MSRNLRLASLARGAAMSAYVLAATASGAFAQPPSVKAAQDPGTYLTTAGGPLVGPTLYDTGDAQATISRQQASGYFATAGAPLVAPYGASDPSATLSRQRASDYFATAGAPLYAPTTGSR